MLSAEGCRQRRQRLWQTLDPKPDSDYLLLTDPIHLTYLANFWVDPFSLGGGFGGYLLVRNDGHAKLIHDNRLPKSVEQAHVESRRVVPWYTGQTPAQGPRQLALLTAVNPEGTGLEIHDQPGGPFPAPLIPTPAPPRPPQGPRGDRAAPPLHACHRRWACLGTRQRQAGHDGAGRLLRHQQRLHPRRRTGGHRLRRLCRLARAGAARRSADRPSPG